ncbi:MAG TPA: hypothetical protein VFL03_17000 [Candidatus Limnocylindrales bacterium]|nr:hypothetical protein [Candidatus Limnocylindrales bacterium]
MWQIQAQMAMDLARERADEARRNDLANRARRDAAWEAKLHRLPVAVSRPRRAAAAGLRAASGMFGSIADAACDAATRLDHRTA